VRRSELESSIWYRVISESGGAGDVNWSTYYELHRVSGGGETLEYVKKAANLGWPTEIDPKDSEYRIYYRQK
jgi:hypothetical protein